MTKKFRFREICRSVVVAVLWMFSGAVSAQSLSSVCEEVRSFVNEGDLVFVEIDNKLFSKVAATQSHWASHVGVAMKQEGEWVVAESTIPVSKMTPLCEFLEKGIDTNIGIRRSRVALTEEEADRLHEAATQRMGILYHTGFKLHSRRLFCSKFVDQIYSQATQRNVGWIQTFEELLENTADPLVVRFWRWWFFGFIPWNRETLTPASQYLDPDFETIYEHEAL